MNRLWNSLLWKWIVGCFADYHTSLPGRYWPRAQSRWITCDMDLKCHFRDLNISLPDERIRFSNFFVKRMSVDKCCPRMRCTLASHNTCAITFFQTWLLEYATSEGQCSHDTVDSQWLGSLGCSKFVQQTMLQSVRCSAWECCAPEDLISIKRNALSKRICLLFCWFRTSVSRTPFRRRNIK